MRSIFISLAFLILANIVTPQERCKLCETKEPPLAKSWTGIYRVRGMEGDKPYAGVMIVRPFGVNTYLVENEMNGAQCWGVGQVQNDMLAVAWVQERKDKSPVVGVSMFQQKSSGVVGFWVVRQNDGKLIREDLTFLGKLDDE